MRILLASASPAARKILRGILEKDGIASGDIVEVDNAPSIQTASPDVVIVDWDLPGLDAPGMARSAGRAGILFCIPFTESSPFPESAASGLVDYIERPFADELFRKKLRSVRDAVEKARAADSAGKLRAITAGGSPELSLPFLLQLPSHLIDELLKRSNRRRHPPGTVLLRTGDVPESLHIVTRGEVEILEGKVGLRSRVSGEGDPFGELCFMTARPSEDTVRARTTVEVASISKAELAEVLRRHPRMGDYLSSLLSRHSKTLEARATTLSHADFKGTLDITPFSDLIQLLGSTRKTGVLGFRDDFRSGAIYLEDGEAVHAWTDDLQGEDAFLDLATWKGARFAFRSIKRQEPRTLKTATMILLLEAMRRQEDRSKTPSPEAGGQPF